MARRGVTPLAVLVAVIIRASSASSTCSRTLHDACERCRAASPQGTCKPAYKWSWQASLQENDNNKTYLHGMQGLRGIEALGAPGVETIAVWNQSNWPGIVRELAPGIVRAASEADRRLMCTIWNREHSYQSWPVLLGCPGRPPAEYEPPCANIGAIVRIPCASIDLTGDSAIAGGIFDSERWLRIGQYVHPPDICQARQAVPMGDVGIAMSVHPRDMGHFVPEQLPKVMLLHLNLPPEVPILVAEGPVVRR